MIDRFLSWRKSKGLCLYVVGRQEFVLWIEYGKYIVMRLIKISGWYKGNWEGLLEVLHWIRCWLAEYIGLLKKEKHAWQLYQTMRWWVDEYKTEWWDYIKFCNEFSSYPQAYFPHYVLLQQSYSVKEMGEIGEQGERFLDNQRIEEIYRTCRGSNGFCRWNMRMKTIINPFDRKTRIERTTQLQQLEK